MTTQVDAIDRLSHPQSKTILDEVQPKEAENVRFLTQYNNDCAGGLMNSEDLAYKGNFDIDDVLADLRNFSAASDDATCHVDDIYVVSPKDSEPTPERRSVTVSR